MTGDGLYNPSSCDFGDALWQPLGVPQLCGKSVVEPHASQKKNGKIPLNGRSTPATESKK